MYAVRIAKKMNGEPISKLSTELINRLVERWRQMDSKFPGAKQKNRKKALNFEYTTKKFLIMEGEFEKSECYNLHKTTAVLNQADKSLALCCKKLEVGGNSSWAMQRSR